MALGKMLEGQALGAFERKKKRRVQKERGHNQLLGPRKCRGAMSQMEGWGRYGFIGNILLWWLDMRKWGRRLLTVFSQISYRKSVRWVLLFIAYAYERSWLEKTGLILRAS